MGIKLGLVGLGAFGSAFTPLFASHPLVDSVILCDAEADKVEKQANDPAVAPKVAGKMLSLEEVCKSDCDAVVIITQPWLHAPQCIQVMETGKYVYSAVPVISFPMTMKFWTIAERSLRQWNALEWNTCWGKQRYTAHRPCSAAVWQRKGFSAIMFMLKRNTPMTWMSWGVR